MEQAYAQALWQMIEGGEEPKKALHSLVESLKAHGRESLLPRIGRAFQRLAEREMRKSTVTISIAHEKDASGAKKEALKILEAAGADTNAVDICVDESLIGGWRLEGAGVLVDNSFKKSLLEMYNHATS